MQAVVFELPAQRRFAGLGDARQVPCFIGVFHDVAHRVFNAFDLAFAVVGKSEFPASAVGDGFQLAFRVVAEGDGIAVAVDFFGQLAFAIEVQCRLAWKSVDIAGAFFRERRLHERRLGDIAFAGLGERNGPPGFFMDDRRLSFFVDF